MSNTPLQQAWSRLKDCKVNIRNCHCAGNTTGALAHIQAARIELSKIEQELMASARG